jgi:hypothetical protein
VKFDLLCVFAEFHEANARCFLIDDREILRIVLNHPSLRSDYYESDSPSFSTNASMVMMNWRMAVTSYCYINVITDSSCALFSVSSNLAAPGQVGV